MINNGCTQFLLYNLIQRSPRCHLNDLFAKENAIVRRKYVHIMNETLPLKSLEETASQQKYYACNLAEVNESQDVISTQDIYNENGLLVVKGNTRITCKVAEQILQHRLLQPLENQVKLERTVTSSELGHEINLLLDTFPDLMQIHHVLEFQPVLDSVLNRENWHPTLMQELTVMRECLPREYQKTLFCAWLSALIAWEMDMKKDIINVAFFAGLAHDIGLLHISPDIIHKKDTLTPGEWRALQSHVVVGYLLIRKLEGEGSRTAMAVLEHHECCDGSGYPLGKTEENLNIVGQIVGMADSLQAIRINQFVKHNRNLRDALPYLHMNAHVHFLKVYKAICSILVRSHLGSTRANTHIDAGPLISCLLEQGGKLQRAVVLMTELVDLTKSDKNAWGTRFLKIAQPVVMMIRSSGLVEEKIFSWLKTLQKEKDRSALDDLTDMELMQNELKWQIKKVAKVINDIIDREGSSMNQKQRDYLGSIYRQFIEI